MIRYNLVMQHDESDCGAACIATVAKYYKIDMPIYKIRELCKTNNEGTNFYGLVNAAKEIGFLTKAVKGNNDDITKEYNKPAIAHIVTEEGFGHYVIIYKVKKNTIVIGDPDKGIVKYKIEEFKKKWTGYLLVLVPSLNLKVDESSNIEENIIKQLINRNKNLILQVLIISSFVSVFTLASTMYTKILLDNVLPNNSYSGLKAITIIFFVLSLSTLVLTVVNSLLKMYFGYKLEIPLKLSLINHITKLPINFFNTRTTGEILARINDVEIVSNLISKISLDIIINIIIATIGGITLLIFNKLIFILACISLIVYYIIFKVFKNGIKIKTKASIIAGEKLHQSEIDILKGIQTIKTTSSETTMNDIYEIHMSTLIRKELDFSKYMIVYTTITALVKLLFNTVISFLVAKLVLDGEITIGTMIMFSTIFGMFINPIESLINLQPQLESMKVSLIRLKEIFIIETENFEDRIKLQNLKKNIEIKNLSFSYVNYKNTIDNMNLLIPKNSMVGIVGKSGSGKSTIAKLLIALYKPDKGEILFDETNINDIGVETLRKHIIYIDQEPNFFKDTILNNLTLGLDEYKLEDVIELCKKVGIHNKIRSISGGYNGELMESATNLSQGEKQRMNIARGLLMKPEILILDEVTSNLDYISEKIIFNLLEELSSEITIILITHRLKSVKSCDEIIFIEDGKIIEKGCHKDLMNNKNGYFEMYSTQ